MTDSAAAGEACESCGRLVHSTADGWAECIPGAPGVSLVILHDLKRCREAADASRRGVVDVIREGELVDISVSPNWLAKAKKDVWQREQR